MKDVLFAARHGLHRSTFERMIWGFIIGVNYHGPWTGKLCSIHKIQQSVIKYNIAYIKEGMDLAEGSEGI